MAAHQQDRTSFDSSLVLSDTQTIGSATDDVGDDSGGTPIELDVTDFAGEPVGLNISVDSFDNGDGDETYQVDIQFSNDDFSTSQVGGSIVMSRDTADNTHFQVLSGVPQDLSGTIKARVTYTTTGTTPSLVVDKAWLSAGRP